MLDPNITKAIQAYLAAPAAERDVVAGAEVLLQLNRNRILYQNIIRHPDRLADKLEYELKKHLQIRLDGLTLQEVEEMNHTVVPSAAQIIAEGAPADGPTGGEAAATFRGKRPDHEQLPAEVRAIYDRGGELYQRIRDTYNTLLNMADAEPCDRYEYLKILAALDKEYREGWETYDHYQPAPADTPKDAPKDAPTSDAAPTPEPTTATSDGAAPAPKKK